MGLPLSDIPADATVLLSLIVLLPLVAFLLLLSFVVTLLAKKYGVVPRDRRVWLERRAVWMSAGGFLCVYLAAFLYGVFVEARWVATTETQLKVAQPVLGRERTRIVHLSDLHLERVGPREERMVELVCQARPDLILLTGDYINVREGAAALDEVLTALGQIAPVYGILGNWDSKFPTSEIFRRAKATLLIDESTLIERDGRKLRLVGQEVHPKRPLKELLRGLNDDAYTIFLSHKPDAVDELHAREPGQRVDLFLCGHTHGGQVRLPFWGAVMTLSKYHKRFECGLYNFEGVPVYVNRGVGCQGGSSPRVRFLCRPEVAIIDLVAAK